MILPKTSLFDTLSAALLEDIGLVVSSDDPQALRTELYKMRKEFVQFLPLSIIISPLNPAAEVIILRQEMPDEKEA